MLDLRETSTKITTITAATAATLLIAMAAQSTFVRADDAAALSELISLNSVQRLTTMDNGQNTDTQVNSLRVTQSTEDGLEVECKGNLKCEIIDDDTVVATSKDNNTTIVSTMTTATTNTAVNQSNIAQFSNDFDVIDEQDLGDMIEGMVDRLLDEISENL